MATRPPSYYGNDQARISRLPQPEAGAAARVADGLGAAGQATFRAGAQDRETEMRVREIDAQVAHLDRQRERDVQRSAFSVRFLELTGELDAATIEAQANAAPGAAGYVEAERRRVHEATDALLGDIADPELQREFAPRVAMLRTQRISAARTFGARANAEAIATSHTRARSTSANNIDTASDPRAALALGTETLAGLRAGYRGLSADALAALESADNEALGTALVGRLPPDQAAALIESGALNAMVPAARLQALTGQVEAEQRRQAAETAQAASNARTELNRRIELVKQQSNQGIVHDDAMIERLAAQASNSGLDGDAFSLDVMRLQNNINREFPVGTRPERVEAEINRLTALGERASAQDQVRLRHLTERQPELRAAFRGDQARVAAAERDPPPPLEDIPGRQRWARRRSAATGNATGVFTNEDAASASERLDDGPAARLALAQEVVQRGGAPDLIRVTARQVAPRDEVFNRAVALGTLRDPREARRRMRDALEGAAALAAAPGLIDPSERAEIWQEIGPALRLMRAEQRAAVIAVADNLYAAEHTRNGGSTWNEDRYRRAAQDAIGALGGGEAMTGGVQGFRFGRAQATVVVPDTMTRAAFEEEWARLPARPNNANGDPVHPNGEPLSTEELRAMTPVWVGGSNYALWTGAGWVGRRGARGPYMLDLARARAAPMQSRRLSQSAVNAAQRWLEGR